MNTDGEKLGTLKEIMFDLSSGEVAYAVLARGGMAGMGSKLFAVPWQLISVDGDNKRLVVDVVEDVLDNSPGFDSDNWPRFSDIEWLEGLHRHFGVDPYWNDDSPPLT